jgi:hypothetical protein
MKSSANSFSIAFPNMRQTQTINKCNKMYIMNAESGRESDPENFDVRITEFGVVVGKV